MNRISNRQWWSIKNTIMIKRVRLRQRKRRGKRFKRKYRFMESNISRNEARFAL